MIIQAAKNGSRIDGASIYVTASPCWNCFKAICNVGIKRIIFEEFYRDERIFEVSQTLGIAKDDLIRARDAQVPLLGKMGTAWDVAHAAVFLASDEARYITGTELVVDGGLTGKFA